MTTTLGELFRHNRWANERLLEACRPRAESLDGWAYSGFED